MLTDNHWITILVGGKDAIANEFGHSVTGGAKVMGIEGRMASVRERMIGMTDAERAWRAKWLKDQVLHDEPIVPKDYYKERYNPIRRFYRAPMDKFEAILTPKFVRIFLVINFF